MKARNNKKASAESVEQEAKDEVDGDKNGTNSGLRSEDGTTVRGILGGMVVQKEVVDITGDEGARLVQPFVEGTTTHFLDLENRPCNLLIMAKPFMTKPFTQETDLNMQN